MARTHENRDRDDAVAAFRRLHHSGYLTIDNVILDGLGDLHQAVYLAKLMYWSKYTDDDGWFTRTVATIERVIGMTRRQQDTARKALVDRDLIEVARRGVPAKLYYRINWDEIVDLAAGTPPRPEDFERDDFDASMVQSSLADSYKLDRTEAPDKRGGSGHSLTSKKSSSTNEKGSTAGKRKREIPAPSPPPPAWTRLDPIADRDQVLRSPHRPEVPTLAQADPETVTAWQELQEEWDRRRGHRP